MKVGSHGYFIDTDLADKKANIHINGENMMQLLGEIINQIIIQDDAIDRQRVQYVVVVMAICSIIHFSVNNKAFLYQ